jgi:hypothetical protein
MNIMLSCIEGSLEVSDTSGMKIIEFYLEVIDPIQKQLQRSWVHSKDTLGFRL